MPELVAGTGITLTPNTSDGTLTVSSSGGGSGVIDLTTSVVADDSTVNSAAAVEALVAAVAGSNGVEIVPWRAIARFDRGFRFNRTVKWHSHGMGGYSGSTPLGGTVLKVPTGSTGIRFLHGTPNAGLSELGSISIAQYGAALSDGTASYNPSTSRTTVTVSSGAANFSNNQVCRLEGAGPSKAIADRTFAITSGSNVATISTNSGVPFIGNPCVYVGQKIKFPGAGASGADLIGYVGAWTTTTITIVNAAGAALNAGTTVSGAQYTIWYPAFFEIQSGGGTTTLTIDDPGFQAQAATNEPLRHSPPAIYSTVKIACDKVFCGMGTQGIGALLRGTTSDGSNVDGSSFTFSYFNSQAFGLVLEGSDAQVVSTFSCDFAGPMVQMLDMGELGSYHFGAHFAFNIGPVVTYSGAVSSVVAGYMEDGTSWDGPPSGGKAAFLNTKNGLPYSGWNAVYFSGGSSVHRGIEGDTLTLDGGFSMSGSGSGSSAYLGGNISGVGAIPGISGFGYQIGSDRASGNWLTSYQAPGGSYAPAHIEGSEVWLSLSFNSADFKLTSAGVNIKSGMTYSVAGTQVVAARDTGWAAWTGTGSKATKAVSTATTADCAAAIKSILDAMIAHGLIGA